MRTLAAILLFVAMAATVGFWLAREAEADSAFAPTTTVQLCNALPGAFIDPALAGSPGCADDLTPSTAAARTYRYSAPVGQVNLHTLVTFSPNATVPGGAFGDKVAGARWITSTGVANGPCSNIVTIDFVLYKVDPASASSYPLAPGSGSLADGRFDHWRVGSTAIVGDSGVVAGVTPTNAGPASLPLTNVPQYVLDMFSPATPTGVYGGLTQVSGQWVPLYLAEFAAGGLTTAPGAFSKMNSTMGVPLVWILGDPTTPIQQSGGLPFGVNDYCDTTSIDIMLPGATNPAPLPPPGGTHYFMQYAVSQRDADQDGYENILDPCPLNAAPAENPRTGAGDADGDGIGDSCDTTLPVATGSDVDSDGEVNRYDNCPQTANGGTSQSDASETSYPADLGPRFDGIGDSCDSGTLTITQNGTSVTVGVGGVLSSSVANGRYHTVTNLVPKCFEAVDTDDDNDGYCDANDNADSGSCAGTVPPSCFIRHTSWNIGACGTHPACQMDSDGDTVVPTSGVISKWNDHHETYLGTDPTKPCSLDDPVNNETPLDSNPMDFDDNRTVTGGDWLKLAGVISNGGARAINLSPASGLVTPGTATTPAYLTVPGMGTQSQQRFDLNIDGQLSLGSELGKLGTVLGKPCGVPGTMPLVNGCGTRLASAASIGNTTIKVVHAASCNSSDQVQIEIGANSEWATVISATNTESDCSNAVDDDGDGRVNDGCPQIGPSAEFACSNALDDDSDGAVNDGCPAIIETITLASPLTKAHPYNTSVAGTFQQ